MTAVRNGVLTNGVSTSTVRDALRKILDLRAQIAAIEAARTEPIAIVGAGCRLPGGVHGLDSLWRLLARGVDAVGEPPTGRFVDGEGECSLVGGFLDAVDGFDAAFFEIGDAEAEAMDPQQRILLEVCMEALEDAGISPERMAGSRTGVYIGMTSDDYSLLAAKSHAHGTSPLVPLGSARALASGRIAHVFGFEGPALQLDTMCSSSLVAVHLACQALRTGAVDAALAGGVNALLAPEYTIATRQLGLLSKTGRCRSFAADADGYVRGEGCAVLMLKRLADATTNGDHILAVIRGSDANHSGRSNGLTAPSGAAMRAVIRRALEEARVEPASIQYVEAQGTATPIGDPIELAAIGDALAGPRPDPLFVGAIKSNIGHLEAAAGIAGLLKAVLALQHGAIPPNLHFSAPTPLVAWDKLGIEVATALRPWPAHEGPRRASVNVFGMSGTNVHVVLEEAPRRSGALDSPGEREELFVISAKSPKALRARASELAAWVDGNETTSLHDVAFTLREGRASYAHRAAIVASTHAALARSLRAVVADEPAPNAWRGEATSPTGRRFAAQDAPLAELAAQYVRGASLEGTRAASRGRACRVPLPTYPFEHRRFWLAALREKQSAPFSMPDATMRMALTQAHPAQRHAQLRAWLRAEVARAAGIAADAVGNCDRFFDLGLTSLAAVELRARVNRELRLDLSPTIALDHPTLEALAAYIERALGFVSETIPAAFVPVPLEEPIALVGMACRFPGADDADAFWKLLSDGVDSTRELPAGRWPIPAGAGRAPRGGYLDDVDGFDAAFFGITPREAVSMDPQQRMLLETCWHALEDAALAPDRLLRGKTGVFVGISGVDYLLARSRAEPPEAVEAYWGSGNAHSVAAGRIAYFFGFTGPAVAIDTACSSSLVALHLGCESLRRGECVTAIVAGVNLLLAPEATVAFHKAGMLAADGRCKTFDESADGYARGDGCAAVVLKRLSDARADGDRILAIVRGSAVNQDGASGGLTVPNGPSQRALIETALARAGIAPRDVAYVEAHGTGTPLGDPIEVRAISEAYVAGRGRDEPLRIGSVKTNLGHLEACAGLAGLAKVVLALRHERLPRHLHAPRPSSRIPWSELGVSIATEDTPWPRCARPRLSGVSSFGFAGTNAHVLLEEAPLDATVSAALVEGTEPRLVVLSAKSPEALDELAQRWVARLDGQDPPSLDDAAFTAATGRAHLSHRMAVVATTRDELRKALARPASEGKPRRDVRGTARPAPPRVAFAFSGQGVNLHGVGAALYRRSPVARAAFDRVFGVVNRSLDRPLASVMWGDDPRLLTDTRYAQPALFAIEIAVAEQWRAWGLVPDIVVGHSVGDFAAACVAGVMSVEDGARLVAERGRLMAEGTEPGAMLAALGSVDLVRAAVARAGAGVAIAAEYGSTSVVVSGAVEAVRKLGDQLVASGVRVRALEVTRAFHSPLMDPILSSLRETVARASLSPPTIEVVASSTGSLVHEELTTADHWARHARDPVKFADALEEVVARGASLVLEVGPGGTLIAIGQRCVAASVTWIASLPAKLEEHSAMLAAAGEAWVNGVPLTWSRFFDRPRRRVSLPAYPFQHRRFWFGTNDIAADASSAPGPEAEDVATRVRRIVASVARLDIEQVRAAQRLAEDIGLDSLMTMELAAKLQRAFGIGEVPIGLVMGGATVGDLVAFTEAHASSDAGAGVVEGPEDRSAFATDAALRAFRAWSSDPTNSLRDRVPREWVHKAQDQNVLVARIDRLADGSTIAEITHDPEHSFFYEHPQDHVPGLYLIEAVRQLGVASAHLHSGVPFGRPFVLHDMRARFDRFAEHGEHLFAVCTFRDPVHIDGILAQAGFEAMLVQNDRVIGKLEGTGFVASPTAYRAMRGEGG